MDASKEYLEDVKNAAAGLGSMAHTFNSLLHKGRALMSEEQRAEFDKSISDNEQYKEAMQGLDSIKDLLGKIKV